MVPLAIAATAVGLTACGSTASTEAEVDFSVATPAAKSGVKEVSWGLNAEPSTLDPIYSYNFYDDQVIANVCESLYRLNPDLTRSPELATSAKRTSPTTWVYDIRKGVKFFDGNEMTAEDVAYSLLRNLSPESYFNLYYTLVKDIKATGRYQVTVELKKPDSLWNQVLPVTGSSVIEKAWAEKEGKAVGTPEGGLMCTGPYEIGSWTRGSNITLTRNPDYWGKAALTPKIAFHFLANPSAQTEALVGGGIEGMFLIDPSGIPRLQASPGHVYFGRNLMLNYLIPTAKKGPLNDTKVRQALALVIDRPAIAKTIYHGAAQPMRTLVTPTIWGNDPKIKKIYEPEWNALKMYASPDIEKAKQLFEAAGSPSETITLAFPTGGAEQQIAESVQSSAKQIGMNIALKGYTYTGIANLYYEPEAQVKAGIDLIYAPFDVDATDPFALYHTFLRSVHSIYNYSGFYNAQANKLLEEAQATYNDVARAEKTAAAEKIIMKYLPNIPLVSPYVMAYLNESVTGTPTSYSVYWSSWANQLGASGSGGS
ncbi:MAG: ABC transporter substrate-binding protein [Actinobacteria bacterium]|nr:ABC transporter substrate-binding protein [Actinomycetota bacterium]